MEHDQVMHGCAGPFVRFCTTGVPRLKASQCSSSQTVNGCNLHPGDVSVFSGLPPVDGFSSSQQVELEKTNVKLDIIENTFLIESVLRKDKLQISLQQCHGERLLGRGTSTLGRVKLKGCDVSCELQAYNRQKNSLALPGH